MSHEPNELGARQPPPTDRSESAPKIVSVGASQLEGASDVLLLGPMRRSLDDEVCSACLEAASGVGPRLDAGTDDETNTGAAPRPGTTTSSDESTGTAGVPEAGRNVLLVSLTQQADDRLAVVRNRFGRLPEHVGVVSCTDQYGSTISTDSPAAATSASRSDGGETSISVDVVEDPSDLPKLGIAITRMAEGLRTAGGIVVCVHSVTALLQYAEPQRVFRFIHVLQNQLDGVRHYHMDSDAHDRQTIATLRPLFDRVVEFDADGTVTVTK